MDVFKFLRTDKINLKVLKELANVTPRVLPVISKKKKHDHWGRLLKTGKKVALCLSLKKAQEKEPRQLQASWPHLSPWKDYIPHPFGSHLQTCREQKATINSDLQRAVHA